MALKETGNRASADQSDEATDLLSRLRDAHERLAQAMAALDAITREAAASTALPVALPSARWRLSAANRARRAVWEECYRYLLPLVDVAAAKALTAIKSADIEMARASVRHIARWPTQSVAHEWQVYCLASRSIRGRMHEAMEAEKRVLYPLLRMQRWVQPLKRAG